MRHYRKISLLLTLFMFSLLSIPVSAAGSAPTPHNLGVSITAADRIEINNHNGNFIHMSNSMNADGDKTAGAALNSSQRIPNTAGLPSSDSTCAIDWSADMPPVGYQGQQMSCVGWSMSYAYKSYEVRQDRSLGYGADHLYSPSYIYNQINHGQDKGASPIAAANLLVAQGCDTLDDMPYSVTDYKTQPTAAQKAKAVNFKDLSWISIDPSNLNSLQGALDNAPTQVDITVYWTPGWLKTGEINAADVGALALGGGAGNHFICLVGYDDTHITKDGTGAFKFINSWGSGWGQGGYGWISYQYMRKYNGGQGIVIVSANEAKPTTTLVSTTVAGQALGRNITNTQAGHASDIDNQLLPNSSISQCITTNILPVPGSYAATVLDILKPGNYQPLLSAGTLTANCSLFGVATPTKISSIPLNITAPIET